MENIVVKPLVFSIYKMWRKLSHGSSLGPGQFSPPFLHPSDLCEKQCYARESRGVFHADEFY